MRSASEIHEAGWSATSPSAEMKWPVKSRSRVVLAKSLSDAPIHPLPRVRRLGERADSVIDRRTFLAGTGAVLLEAPLAAEAQQTRKIWRIGWLNAGSPPANPAVRGPFRQGLQDLGYVEGRDLIMEWRFAEGHSERLLELAADLVRARVDV